MTSRIMEHEQELLQAIALFYDQIESPKVVAKGHGQTASNIIQLAKANDVHLHEDPILMKQLEKLDIGDRIPEHLYQIIAEIIAFVYWLEGKTPDSDKNNASEF